MLGSMTPRRMNLYFFNWPSHVGGADTKLVHLLPLLSPWYDITLIPNHLNQLQDPEWSGWVLQHGFHACLATDLPDHLEGWAISLCNTAFLDDALYLDARRKGLKIAWSNEMMWHFKTELGALCFGRIDTVLYTSPAQRAVLEPGYRAALEAVDGVPEACLHKWGRFSSPGGQRHLAWVETGNWIDPAQFPFRARGGDGHRGGFAVGRVSRPDPDKFPDDFPSSWEGLGLRDPVRFRVLGWSAQMTALWENHAWDDRWELLPAGSVPVVDFLNTVDLLVYEVGPRFRESWGRAVVEAMLCGVVPLVPAGPEHHLEQLVPHGMGGFVCNGREDFGTYARQLQDDPALLQRMSLGAREWASQVLCRASDHLALWHRVFQEIQDDHC